MRSEAKFVARVAVILSLIPALAAQARVRYVATDGGGTDGLSWGSAYRTIQQAIDDSAIGAGDEIHVKGGTYVLGLAITVNKAVKILGGYSGTGDTRDWDAYVTTVNGNNGVTCMIVSDNAQIEGFVFTEGYAWGGFADARGGAIRAEGCSPVVSNCTFLRNKAVERGGAIGTYNANGMTIRDCTFTENRAAYYGGAIANWAADVIIQRCSFQANQTGGNDEDLGGAVFNQNCGPTITDCTFTENSSRYGAGVCNYMADALIEGCSFADSNSTTIGGGGVANFACSARISRCLFANNDAIYGGAIYEQSTSTIANCILWKNSCVRYGGGLYVEHTDGATTSRPTIVNCTLYGNVAVHGGAVYTDNAIGTLRNCIIWGNTSYLEGPGIWRPTTGTATPDVQSCDIQGDSVYPGTGNVRVEPGFADPNNGDFELVWGSPCIDVGDNSATGMGNQDYEGKVRVVDGTEDGIAVVDLGALEFRGRFIDDYLFHVELTQNIIYESPSDASAEHVFLLVAETADTVSRIQFHTPGSNDYAITSTAHVKVNSYIDTYHYLEGGKDIWEYRAAFAVSAPLSDYGDGRYYLTLLYKDGTSHTTTLWYGVPNTLTELARPTQKPTITSPSYGGITASPAVLTWNACTDAAANAVYSALLDPADGQVVADEILGVTATKCTGFSVDEGLYNAQVAFENRYELMNEDNVPFAYGKTVLVSTQFEVPYTTVYRFWSPTNKRHFYTINPKEKQKLIDRYSDVWTYEGPAYNACATEYHAGLLPVYRFWSSGSQTHFYTISESEKNKLIQRYADVWTFEGMAFRAYVPGTQPPGCAPVYRFWNAGSGTHFYTINESEKNKLLTRYADVYAYEGIAFYAYP
jgi:hypothetical protein